MAYDFTGVNTKYLSGAPPLTAPPFSLACWGWQDAIVSSKNTLLYLGVSSTDANFWQLYTDNATPPKVGVIMKDGSTFSGSLSALTAATGQWNHYGMEVPTPTTQGKVYVNGTQSAGLSNNVTPAGMDIFGIGCAVGSTKQQPWDGAIGEVAGWNVLLTAAEWAALAKGIDPRLIRPSALVFYRDLIRHLNRPYGPGATLTNTGSVGVRAHRPMVYRSHAQKATLKIATGGPALTVPGEQSATMDAEKAISGVSVSSDTIAAIQIQTGSENARCKVTLSGSVTIIAGANDSNDFTLGGGASVSEYNTVLATLASNKPFRFPVTLTEYPVYQEDSLITIRATDELAGFQEKYILVHWSLASGPGERMVLISGTPEKINAALDEGDGGVVLAPDAGFFGNTLLYVESIGSGGVDRDLVDVIVENVGAPPTGRGVMGGVLTGVLQGVC